MSKTVSKKDKFQEQFERIAADYDMLEPVPLSIHKKITQNLPEKKGRMLEIGCGTGRLLLELKDKFNEIIGIDFSSNMLKISRSRLGNKAKLVKSSIEDYDLKNKRFDFIVSNGVFHHVERKEMVRILDALKEALNRNGIIFISDFITISSLKQRHDWVYTMYKVFDRIKNPKLILDKKQFKKELMIREHLKEERGMFFTKKEFYNLLKTRFPGCKFGVIGKKRDLIKLAYAIWKKE